MEIQIRRFGTWLMNGLALTAAVIAGYHMHLNGLLHESRSAAMLAMVGLTICLAATLIDRDGWIDVEVMDDEVIRWTVRALGVLFIAVGLATAYLPTLLHVG